MPKLRPACSELVHFENVILYTVNSYFSNTDISKNLLIRTSYSYFEHFSILFTSELLLSQLLISQSKFSGARKFTLRYRYFGTNSDFEISRVNCLCFMTPSFEPFAKNRRSRGNPPPPPPQKKKKTSDLS